jgi:hypothetical protein
MKMTGQLHAPASLHPGQQIPVPIIQDDDMGGGGQSRSERHGEENNLLSLPGSKPDFPVVQPVT